MKQLIVLLIVLSLNTKIAKSQGYSLFGGMVGAGLSGNSFGNSLLINLQNQIDSIQGAKYFAYDVSPFSLLNGYVKGAVEFFPTRKNSIRFEIGMSKSENPFGYSTVAELNELQFEFQKRFYFSGAKDKLNGFYFGLAVLGRRSSFNPYVVTIDPVSGTEIERKLNITKTAESISGGYFFGVKTVIGSGLSFDFYGGVNYMSPSGDYSVLSSASNLRQLNYVNTFVPNLGFKLGYYFY